MELAHFPWPVELHKLLRDGTAELIGWSRQRSSLQVVNRHPSTVS